MSSALSIPHTKPPRWPPVGAGRFAASIRRDEPGGCAIALLGLPDDNGIRLNGGRPGAAQGPAAFRAALAGFGTSWDAVTGRALAATVFDAGDIEPVAGGESALLETHARVQSAVLALHQAGLLPVCVGGGHDLTLPGVTALAVHSGRALGGINFDAHLDVRERMGSGMAFRRLIEGNFLDPRHFVELGLGRFVNDEVDLRWLAGLGATRVFEDSVSDGEVDLSPHFNAAFREVDAGFVSIDLDAVDSAAAPGVSALNPTGLSVRCAAALAEAAGREPKVRHFDLMELSPPNDLSGRTARVVACLFLSFVAGFGARPR